MIPHEHEWEVEESRTLAGKAPLTISRCACGQARKTTSSGAFDKEAIEALKVRTAEATRALKEMSEAMSEAWKTTAPVVSAFPETITWAGPMADESFTTDEALDLILREIEQSDDVRKVAGEWLTRFTNGVTAIIRKADEDAEDE